MIIPLFIFSKTDKMKEEIKQQDIFICVLCNTKVDIKNHWHHNVGLYLANLEKAKNFRRYIGIKAKE
jgi:hypothetical protein